MSGMTVYINGEARDPDAYRALSEKLIAFVRDNEPGCTTYEWHLGEDGTTFNIDGYDSTEAFVTHIQSAQQQGFLDRFMEAVDIQRVTVTGDPSEIADPILEQFGADVVEFVGSI